MNIFISFIVIISVAQFQGITGKEFDWDGFAAELEKALESAAKKAEAAGEKFQPVENFGTTNSFNNFGDSDVDFSNAVFNTGGFVPGDRAKKGQPAKSFGTTDSFNNFDNSKVNYSGGVFNTGFRSGDRRRTFKGRKPSNPRTFPSSNTASEPKSKTGTTPSSSSSQPKVLPYDRKSIKSMLTNHSGGEQIYTLKGKKYSEKVVNGQVIINGEVYYTSPVPGTKIYVKGYKVFNANTNKPVYDLSTGKAIGSAGSAFGSNRPSPKRKPVRPLVGRRDE